MGKKLMMMVALCGGLFLTSCVDNNESESVTDVRNAKAEQLRSIAAMNNAEAAAKQIIANAQAALMTAQAEAEKAMAAKILAEAELLKKQAELVDLQKQAAEIQNEADRIANQKAQTELEKAILDLETAKKQAELDLARIAAEMERMQQEAALELEKLKLELKKAQQDLIDYEKQLADNATQEEKDRIAAERQELQKRADAYAKAIQELIDAQKKLSELKKDLVLMNAGLTNLEAAKQEAILANNNQISLLEKRIATYKQYTNHTEDVTALTNKRTELVHKGSLLYDQYRALYTAYTNVQVTDAAYEAEWQAIVKDDIFSFMSYFYVQRVKADNSSDYHIGNNTVPYPINNYSYPQINVSYAPVIHIFESSDGTPYDEEFGDTLYISDLWGEFPAGADIRKLEIEVDNYLATLQYNKEYYEDLVKDLQAQYNGKATGPLYYDEEGLQPVYDEDGNHVEGPIRNAVDSAAYLYAEYQEETKEPRKTLLLNLFNAASNREVLLKNDIANYESGVEYFASEVTTLTEYWKFYPNMQQYVEALQVKLDAYNKVLIAAYTDKIAAWEKSEEAWSAYYDVLIEIDAIEALLNGSNGQTGAQDLLAMIEAAEAEIERLKAENEDVSAITDQKELITYQEALIAAQEVVVKAKEAALAAAKADLDEVMPEE
jgi:hypothetical protein